MESEEETRCKPVDEPKPLIERVDPDSIAAEMGIERGDTVLAINGRRPRDLIDYRYLCADEELEIDILKNSGEVWVCDIRKEYDEDLGLGFAADSFDGTMLCANKCIFCFIDQMPPDLRSSLYLKDDDYRLSFLHGNFITLTNLKRKDWDRILTMKLSPLYISVHSTDPNLREHLLHHKRAGRIMEQLTLLAHAGIEMHTQIVLCPGVNDGDELAGSIRDLSTLWPWVKSIAIVPVGLTRFRENLRLLRKFTAAEAAALVDRVHQVQKEFQARYGSSLVYLGDEFYVLAGRGFPPAEAYGDFPQLENGVGLVRLFYDSFAGEEKKLPAALAAGRKIAIVTGTAGEYVLRPVVERLNRIENLQVELVGVFNEFFGGQVTVAGLLTGRDVLAALKKRLPFDLVLLPSVMCKREGPVFLDGKTTADLAGELSVPVKVVDLEAGARHLVESILE